MCPFELCFSPDICPGIGESYGSSIFSFFKEPPYSTGYSKTDRERQILYDITYMWNLKKKKRVKINLSTKQRITDVENKCLPGLWGGGVNWETDIDICIPHCIK